MIAPRRLFFGGAALASLLVGAMLLFAVIVADDALRAPNGLSGGLSGLLLLVPVCSVTAFGGLLGRALVPARVLDAGNAVGLAAGSALIALALLLAVPTPLALFTWPAAAVVMALGLALLRRGLRASPASK